MESTLVKLSDWALKYPCSVMFKTIKTYFKYGIFKYTPQYPISQTEHNQIILGNNHKHVINTKTR